MKLNGGRRISGILRGFDPFMNLVVDETIEETKTGEKHAIGMVVSFLQSSHNKWTSRVSCMLSRSGLTKRPYFLSDLIWVQTVNKYYQQKTEVVNSGQS